MKKSCKEWTIKGEKEFDTFIKLLKGKRFHTEKKGHLHIYHYTSDGTKKLHFIAKQISLNPKYPKWSVSFHIDTVYGMHHKIDINEKVMDRAMKWLKLQEKFE